MDVDVSDTAPIRRIRLRGRLDAPGVESGQHAFDHAIAAAAQPTIVDLSEVSYISSLGVRMLIGAAHALRQRGLRLVLLGAPPLVAESLARVIGSIIPQAASEADALRLLGNG